VTLLIEGVRYQYGFVASDERFVEEWLFAWPNGHKQTWFERDGESPEGDAFKFGDHFPSENRLIAKLTRPNALFLSAAVQMKHSMLLPIYRWFRQIQSLHLEEHLRRTRTPSRHHRFQRIASRDRLVEMLNGERKGLEQRAFPGMNGPSSLDQLRILLRSADIGITDLRAADQEGGRSPEFEFQHGSDNDHWLTLGQESKGTQTLFDMALPVIEATQRGGTIIVDELEASLHPMLAQQIVRQFNSPDSNPRHAQLIFTTHDTNLLGTVLGEPALRRDQVWFTEKDAEGATVLYPLTDYKPRKAENLEQGYLQGRYGAIPFLGEFSLLQEKESP